MALDGLTVTPLRQIDDARGAVLHMLRSNAPEFTQFGECYFSEVLPNAIKGWKRHRLQTQNLAVPTGRIRFVAFDGREQSPTFGQIDVIELGRPDQYMRLCVPPGIWYSFACISSTAALIANCADLPHDPAESEQKPLDDASIPYRWERL